MIYISDKEQEKIKQKILKLPSWLKGPKVPIISFELIGTLIFTYGICAARYMHPIDKRILNPTYEFLISCFYYFALSVASPFSGGHLNPAVSIAFNFLRKNPKLKSYLFAQFLGALIGATIAYLFFGVVPFFYWQDEEFGNLMLDFYAEVFGSFIFMFFALVIVETNYMAGQYFRYLLLAIMLLNGRIFTLRKGGINPAVVIAFQFYAAIQKANALLFLHCLFLVLGQIIGCYLAMVFFKNVYAPLKEGLAMQKMKVSAIDQLTN